MNTLMQDFRYGLRLLLRRPLFTAIVVLTLALGIGANTAIFSVVNSVLLRQMHYAAPDRLVLVWSKNQSRGVEGDDISLLDYLDLRRDARAFAEIAAYGPWGFNITGENEPEKATSVVVTPNLFATLGVQPALGRAFLAEEATPGREKVVILSHALWQRRYGRNPKLVGQTLKLDGENYVVIGIMPPEFRYPNGEVDIWAPLSLVAEESSRASRWLKVVARLQDKVALDSAAREVETIASRLSEDYAKTNAGWSLGLSPLQEAAVKDKRLALLLLFAAVGFVLLIACVNVANLFLARIETRRKEMAIRAAVGAGRMRLVRLLMAESFLLSTFGGAGGLLVATWGLELILAFFPADPFLGPDDLSLVHLDHIAFDGRVLAFAFLLSALTGLFFGLLPALQASGSDLYQSLKESGQAMGGRANSKMRSSLIIAEIAMTLVLLIGAGLLIRSFGRLLSVDPGFRTENLLTFRISPASKYRRGDERLAFYRRVVERLKALPGVTAVGATTSLPFSGTNLSAPVEVEGRREGARILAGFHSMTPDYLSGLGIPLVRGRLLSERDIAGSAPVALINESLARRLWPGEEALGRRLKIAFAGNNALEIVGVVGNTRQMGLETEARPELYVPYTQRPWAFMSFAIRTAADPSGFAKTVRSEIAAIDGEVPIYSVFSMDQRISDSIAKRRFNMVLLGSFAALALVLAAVGIYGVISYAVGRRTAEIGLRIALGASRVEIIKLVIGQGARFTLAGIGIGLGGAMLLTRVMQSLLFEVSAADPLTFVSVTTMLALVALLACYLPARRATRVDPIIALREE